MGAAITRLNPKVGAPKVVALDGRSGSGKSTLALLLAGAMSVAVVHVDDFFAVGIPDGDWDEMSVKQRAEEVFDWRRLRTEAVDPLLLGHAARWHPIDFQSGLSERGTYGLMGTFVEVEPQPIILLDGAYSAGPQLADLVDLSILVEVPEAERRDRLAMRQSADFLRKWHARWDAVEGHYFASVRPKDAFHLVVAN